MACVYVLNTKTKPFSCQGTTSIAQASSISGHYCDHLNAKHFTFQGFSSSHGRRDPVRGGLDHRSPSLPSTLSSFQLQKRGACLDDGSIGPNSGQEDVHGCERPGSSPETGVKAAGTGGRSGSRGRHSGTVYRLAGMSEEERQQMLDLREEVCVR